MEDLGDPVHVFYMCTIITLHGSNLSLAAEAVQSHFALKSIQGARARAVQVSV